MSTTPSPTLADHVGVPDRREVELDRPEVDTTTAQRRWILLATCLGLLAVMVSVSGLNVAQQALATDIGASQGELLWIINGYTVALAATLLPLGALGDRLGRKTVLLAGLTLFAGLNVVAPLAGEPWMLIGVRVAMGVAAALIMPATLSTISAAFPADERGRAVGVWSGVAGGGAVIGLITSSILIDAASWQWLFATPVLIAAVAVAITIRMVPNTRESAGHGFDRIGSLLSVLSIGGIVLAIHEGPEQGWTAPITLAAALVGLVALIGFVGWERRTANPLLDVTVFTNRRLSAGALSLTIMFALIFGLFLVMIQFLQAVLGYSALQSSLALLPMIATMMAASPVAPAITARFGYRRVMITSLVGLGAALAWLALIPSDPGYLDVAPALVLVGLALGAAMTPSTTAITESLPADKQGVASALNDTVRELGGAIGVALIGSVLAAGYRSSIAPTAEALDPEVGHIVEEGIGGAYVAAGSMGADGLPIIGAAQQAFLDGWGNAMWMSAVIAGGAAIVAAMIIPRRAATATDPSAADRELIDIPELAFATAD